MSEMDFFIPNRAGYTFKVLLCDESSKPKSHTKIKKVNASVGKVGTEFSFEDGLNAIKTGTKNETRVVWDEAIRKCLDIIKKDGEADANLKLHFLRDVIFVLVETGRVYVTEPHLLRKIIHSYWDTYLGDKKSTEIPDYLAIDVCERYLGLLEDDANHDWFEREVTGKDSETSREKETGRVSDTLKDLLKSYRNKEKGSNELSEDKKEEKKYIEQALGRAKERLMAWYNLKKAVEIVTVLQERRCLRLHSVISGWLPEIAGALTLAYVVCLKIPYFSKAGFQGFKIYGFDLWIYLIYPLMLLSIGVSFVKLSRETKQVDFQIYLPRMAASIIVGYLVLLSDEAWGGIFGEHEWPFVAGRIVLPCVAVFIYILIEMNNVKGIRYPILGKAFRLFFRGAAYAVLTGMIVSDLFGKAIVRRIPETKDVFFTSCEAKPIHLTGLFGNIYPEVIFYIAPLALFIGVFVQLLWEDKTLTAKI